MKRSVVFLTFLVLTLFGTGVAQADILFNNFGEPGDTYSVSIGWPVAGASLGSVEFAMGFMPSMTANLGSIDLVFSRAAGTNEVDLSLVNDSGSSSPDPSSALESWTFTNEMGTVGTPLPILTADSISNPLLQAGTPYWLIASAPISDTLAIWNQNSIGDIGPVSESDDNGATWQANRAQDRGVFRVNSVPEPSTLLLLGAGLAGVGFLRRRFNK